MSAFCVVSSLLPDDALSFLKKNYRVVALPPDDSLPEPIRCHPDSIFTVIGEELILPAAYYEAYPDPAHKIASLGGFRLTLSHAERGSVYPLDAALNAAVGHDFLLCRPDSAATEILLAAQRYGYTLIPVRQGYAGCACLITDHAVLTGDPGIAKVLEDHRIPYRLFSNEGILLPGYSCGFFGGACGFYGGTLYICGDYAALPCSRALIEFADESGFTILSISGCDVTDVGGIRFLECKH